MMMPRHTAAAALVLLTGVIFPPHAKSAKPRKSIPKLTAPAKDYKADIQKLIMDSLSNPNNPDNKVIGVKFLSTNFLNFFTLVLTNGHGYQVINYSTTNSSNFHDYKLAWEKNDPQENNENVAVFAGEKLLSLHSEGINIRHRSYEIDDKDKAGRIVGVEHIDDYDGPNIDKLVEFGIEYYRKENTSKISRMPVPKGISAITAASTSQP